MKLRLSGYRSMDDEVEDFINLENLNIEVDGDGMIVLHSFLGNAIRDLDQLGTQFSHLHLQDHCDAWQEGIPDIIIHTGKM